MNTNELIALYKKLSEAHDLISRINEAEVFSDINLTNEITLRKADTNLFSLLLSLDREIKTREHKTLTYRNTI